MTSRFSLSSTYIFEEQLSQLLDVVHDFVRTGLLLTYPLHVISYQLWKQDEDLSFPQISATYIQLNSNGLSFTNWNE